MAIMVTMPDHRSAALMSAEADAICASGLRRGLQAWGAVDGEPAGEVGLDAQVVGEDRPDL
jgi:hypothetical protein